MSSQNNDEKIANADKDHAVVPGPFDPGVNVACQDDIYIITHSHFLNVGKLCRNDDQPRNFNIVL